MRKLHLKTPITVLPAVTDTVIIIPITVMDSATATKAINATMRAYIPKNGITSIK
jgi:hypothetical protein